MKYELGQEIREGDKILYAGEPGYVQFLIEEQTGDGTKDWYLQEYGPGVMVIEPKNYQNGTFITDTENAEDLVLVSRAEV